MRVATFALFFTLTVVPVFSQNCQELCDAIKNGELFIATQHLNNGVSASCQLKQVLEMSSSDEPYFREKSEPSERIQSPIHLLVNVDEGYSEWLQLFSEQGVDINSTDNMQQTLLHLAAEAKNEELVKAILDFNPNLNLPDAKGNSALSLLIENETSTELVMEMLKKGANPKKTNELNSALYQAFKFNHLDVAKLLMMNGASPKETNQQGMTCLDAAIENNNIEMIKLAFEYGMDASNAKMEHLTNEAIIKLLIAKGADIKQIDMNNIIAYTNNTALIKWLVDSGANPDQKGFLNQTPLYHAIKKGNLDLVKYLAGKGANLNAQFKDANYLTVATNTNELNGQIIQYLIGQGVPLWGVQKKIRTAIKAEDKKTILFLKQNGLNLANIKLENISSPAFGDFLIAEGAKTDNFDVASIVALGNVEMLKYLEKKKVNLDANNAVYHAVVAQQIPILSYLLKEKNNPNLNYREGKWHYTPLMKAVQNEDLVAIKLLVQAGANINAINDKGETVIQFAVVSKNQDILDYLLNQNISFKKNNHQHAVILVRACIENNATAILDKLIRKGLDVSKVSLTDFIENDNPDMIDVLVKNDVQISTPNQKGHTPLYYAFKKRYYETVNYLLEKGASINDINLAEYMASQKRFDHLAIQFLVEEGIDINKLYKDKSPLQIAIEKNDLKMVQYLVEKGADTTAIKAYKFAKKMNASTHIVEYLKKAN